MDDTFRMADRLLQAGIHTRILAFEGMPHGALNFDMPMGVRECQKVVKLTEEWIRRLLFAG